MRGRFRIPARRGDLRGEPDIRRLAAVGSEAYVPEGQLLIEHGHHGAGLYVVLVGSVVVEAPERRRELGAGSYVGERALLSRDGRRTARVRALTDSLVLAVSRVDFERLCREDPAFAARLARRAA
jgi:voltage-gated potassium channel